MTSERPAPQLLSVGKPYIPSRTRWLEATDYNFRCGSHELRLFFESPSDTEVRAITNGRAEFALYVEGDVIVLCYRFEPMGWSDQSFTWHLVPEDQREEPPDAHGAERATLAVILVDAISGLVRGLRIVTFSAEFTRDLHDAIRAQARRPWPGENEYGRQLSSIYARLRTSDEIAYAATSRCAGGE